MKRLMLFITINYCIGVVAHSQVTSKNNIQQYALSLWNEKRYEESIACFRRLTFFEPTEYLNYYYLAKSHQSLGNYQNASKFYALAYSNCKNDSIRNNITFFSVRNLIEEEKYNYAIAELYSISSKSIEVVDRKNFYLGIIFALQDNYQESYQYLAQLSYLSDEGKEDLKMQLGDLKKKAKRPNPKKAALMSAFLPGSGQFYSGNFEGGINSLLLTGGLGILFFYIAVEISILDAILSIYPWYQRYATGGAQNAKKMALIKKNEKKNKYLSEIINQLEISKKLF